MKAILLGTNQGSSTEMEGSLSKSRDVMIKHGVDLNQFRCDREHQLRIDEGVLKGTAKRFASDIDYWFETTKRGGMEE